MAGGYAVDSRNYIVIIVILKRDNWAQLNRFYLKYKKYLEVFYYTYDYNTFDVWVNFIDVRPGAVVYFSFAKGSLGPAIIADIMHTLGTDLGIRPKVEGLVSSFKNFHMNMQVESYYFKSRPLEGILSTPYGRRLNTEVKFVLNNLHLYRQLYISATILMKNKGVVGWDVLDTGLVPHMLAYDFLRAFDKFQLHLIETAQTALLYEIFNTASAYSLMPNFNYKAYKDLIYKMLIQLEINNIIEVNILRYRGKGGIRTRILLKLQLGVRPSHNTVYQATPYTLKKLGDGRFYNIGDAWSRIIRVFTKKPENTVLRVPLHAVRNANQVGLRVRLDMIPVTEYLFRQKIRLKLGGVSWLRPWALPHHPAALREGIGRVANWLQQRRQVLQARGGPLASVHRIAAKLDVLGGILGLVREYEALLYLKSWKGLIYMPHILDFRGRLYTMAPVSPMSCKEIRSLFTLYHPNWHQPTPLSHSRLYHNLGTKDIDSYYRAVLRMEASKLWLKRTLRGGAYQLDLEAFNYGPETTLLYWKMLDLEEKLYWINLKKGWRALENRNYAAFATTVIIKDATASGLQNFGLILGYRPSSYEVVNLRGRGWTDVYWFVINAFFRRYAVPPQYKKYLSRGVLKKTIMTQPYNVTKFTSKQYFVKAIHKEFGRVEEGVYRDLMAVHDLFFMFLRTTLKEILFQSTDLPVDVESYTFKLPDGAIISLKYKNFQKLVERRFTVGGRTRKFTSKIYNSSSIDENKSRTAKDANIMHGMDAYIIREVRRDNFPVLTIHDMFICQIGDYHILMDRINYIYNGSRAYGLFIII